MTDYNGVVSIKVNGEQATGALLWTGRHIITAAHVLNDLPTSSDININLNLTTNISTPQVISYNLHPGWENNPSNYNNDLAIIELSTTIDSSIERYDIYRDYDELGQIFTRVGYSKEIEPNTGEVTGDDDEFHSGTNIYDTTTDKINDYIGTTIQSQYQLSYDYDNGESENDAWGSILNLTDTGTGSSEVFANPGDSGGPAFINNKIAGIASYIFRYQDSNIHPDITDATDSSYGEIASDTRITKYSNWIDSIVDDNYQPEKPTSADAVDIYPIEGDSGTSTNYFLLEIGTALSIDASVSYETVDGTAKSGSDYLFTSGTATIPAGETQVTIAVEIIGDTEDEDSETFYLKVFDPEGGIFPEGVTELKAQHTIVDNDHDHTNPQSREIGIIGIVTDESIG